LEKWAKKPCTGRKGISHSALKKLSVFLLHHSHSLQTTTPDDTREKSGSTYPLRKRRTFSTLSIRQKVILFSLSAHRGKLRVKKSRDKSSLLGKANRIGDSSAMRMRTLVRRKRGKQKKLHPALVHAAQERGL
jgi:hypothetical protein